MLFTMADMRRFGETVAVTRFAIPPARGVARFNALLIEPADFMTRFGAIRFDNIDIVYWLMLAV